MTLQPHEHVYIFQVSIFHLRVYPSNIPDWMDNVILYSVTVQESLSNATLSEKGFCHPGNKIPPLLPEIQFQ